DWGSRPLILTLRDWREVQSLDGCLTGACFDPSWNGSGGATVARVEFVGVGPADRLHIGLDVITGLGSIIHVIGMLIHVEDEDRLPAGKIGRVIRGPAIDHPPITWAPG